MERDIITRLNKIEKSLNFILNSLQELEERYEEVERTNETLREFLRRIYEHKVRSRCGKDAGEHKSDF